jgi:exodeoxyribonuclease VIII
MIIDEAFIARGLGYTAREAEPGFLLEPGVHEAVSDAHYFALPYCSNSRLSLMRRSPAHLKADIEQPSEGTDAMRLGTAIHAAVLEPELFARRYSLAGSCCAELKSGPRKGQPCGNTGTACHDGEWYCGQHKQDGAPDSVIALNMNDWNACVGIRASLLAHPKLSKLVDAEGRSELTVVWDDPETGVRCKARVDRLIEKFGIVLDLKKTLDARADAFERKIFEFGYYRQLGLYQDGLAAHGIEIKHLVIAALESERPYAVAGYRLSDGAADAGREELRKLLNKYAACQAENNWPAYPNDITELSLPSWAWAKIEEAA